MMNFAHMWALYAREVKRFQKLWIDTIFSPIVSVILYLAIFGVVVGARPIQGTNYLAFVYAGLLAMTMVNASFSNPAFALILSKNVGTIVDLQLVPIPPWRIGVAYALAALTRALITFVLVLLLTFWFVNGIHLQSFFALAAGLFLTGLEFGVLGVIIGMSVKTFESFTFIMTFLMQPMIFLAGVFYPISNLPSPWSTVSYFNPLHHNVNLIRYALTGYSDIRPWISFFVATALCVVLLLVMNRLVRKNLRDAT